MKQAFRLMLIAFLSGIFSYDARSQYLVYNNPNEPEVTGSAIPANYCNCGDQLGSQGAPALPLSITFIQFHAFLRGNDGILLWQTANEQQTDHFVIERSFDAASWRKIGEQKSLGNSTYLRDYEYNDRNITGLGESTIHYRIARVDRSGKARYTGIQSIHIKEGADKITSFYDNETGRLLINIYAIADGPCSISLTDIAGKIVLSRNINVLKGAHQYNINVAELTSGLYSCQIIFRANQFINKIVAR